MSDSYPPELPAPVTLAPDKLARIQAEFSQEWLRIATSAQHGTLEKPSDRRFSGKAWESNSGCLLTAHAYLLSAKVINQMIDAAQAPEPVRQRLRFTAMQWLEAVSPSNFMATNPDVQRTLLESNGESLRLGLQNLMGDIQKGRLSQTDESRLRNWE